MKKSRLYKLFDLVEDIKKVDSHIQMHQLHEATDVAASQYSERKTKLIGNLIDELASPELQSLESFNLIQKVLEKYSRAIHSSANAETAAELLKIEAAL